MASANFQTTGCAIFGFAVTWLEQTAKSLRKLQQVWSDAADDLNDNRADTRLLEPDLPMTDERALAEINWAKQILDKHWDHGMLLGFWQDQYEGFQYRYVDGRYAERAEVEADDVQRELEEA